MEELNKYLYILKKMIKNADSDVLDITNAQKNIRDIEYLCKVRGLIDGEIIANAVLMGLYNKPPYLLISELQKLRKELIKVKERASTMSQREARARTGFFYSKYKYSRKGIKTDQVSTKKRGKHTHISPQQQLAIYDIIMVPTQGGNHQSVVTSIGKDYVECYPITTALSSKLKTIACCSYHLSATGEDGRALRLTSSKTRIPLKIATICIVGHYANPIEIDRALHYFGHDMECSA